MIRIIAGRFRGRKLVVPEGASVRPTTDRMRERVFSILSHHRYPDLQYAVVADMFAGSGALGIEALSRGADHCLFFEQDPKAIAAIKANLKGFETSDFTLKKQDATQPGKPYVPCDIIFMDAPYQQGLTSPTLQAVASKGWLRPDGVIVAEVHAKEQITLPDSLEIVDERKQGVQKTLFIRFAEKAD